MNNGNPDKTTGVIPVKEMLKNKEGYGIRYNSKELAKEYYTRSQRGENRKLVIWEFMKRIDKSRSQIYRILKKGKMRLKTINSHLVAFRQKSADYSL